MLPNLWAVRAVRLPLRTVYHFLCGYIDPQALVRLSHQSRCTCRKGTSPHSDSYVLMSLESDFRVAVIEAGIFGVLGTVSYPQKQYTQYPAAGKESKLFIWIRGEKRSLCESLRSLVCVQA